MLHTHSVWNTLLSEAAGDAGGLALSGYEMLKGLAGVETHEHDEWLPIVENTQDYARMTRDVWRRSPEHPGAHGLLLRGHGLYTWGRDLAGGPAPRRGARVPVRGRGAALRGHAGGCTASAAARREREAKMAVVRVPRQGRRLDEQQAVTAFLAAEGIEHERWTPAHPLGGYGLGRRGARGLRRARSRGSRPGAATSPPT